MTSESTETAIKRPADKEKKGPSPMKKAFNQENEEAKSLFGHKTISELDTSCHNWTLVARLIRSFSKVVIVKNEKVDTLNLIFIDNTGEIRVEAWRKNSATWVNKLKVNTIYKLTGCNVKEIDGRSKPYTRLPNRFRVYINENSKIDVVKMDQEANNKFANLQFQFQDLDSLTTGTVTDVYGLICDISLDSKEKSIVIRQQNSRIKLLINDIHWILDDPTMKNQLKKNQTAVAFRGIQITDILPNIIKAKLYEDSSLMINPRKTGILPPLMDEWLDEILSSDTDQESENEANPAETTGN